MATSSNTSFKVENGLYVVGDAFVNGAFHITGNLQVDGAFASSQQVAGDITPSLDSTFAVGGASLRWTTVWAQNANLSQGMTVGGNVVGTSNNVNLGSTAARWNFFANNADLISFNTLGASYFGQSNVSFNPSTGINTTTDIITTLSAHSFANNDTVVYTVASGNTAVTGLSNGTSYFVVNTVYGSTTLQISTTYGGTALDFTATGLNQIGHSFTVTKTTISNGSITSTSGTANVNTLRVLGPATVNGISTLASNVSIGGTLTVTGNVAVDTDLLFLDAVNNLVGIKNTTPSSNAVLTVSGNVEFSTGNTGVRLNTGNTTLNSSIIMSSNATVGRLLFNTWDNSASAGVQSGGYYFTATAAGTSTFNALTGVANTTEYITTSSAHSFVNNDVVSYTTSAGNTAVSGLSNNSSYYVINANTTALQLSATLGGSALNLTAGISESGHTLTRVSQSLLSFGNTTFQYKSGNVAHAGNFGIYNVSGTRLGP